MIKGKTHIKTIYIAKIYVNAMSTKFNFLSSLDLSSLNIQEKDLATKKFLMLLEGQTTLSPQQAAAKYGYTLSYYYEVLRIYRQLGMNGLIAQKRGPKANSVRSENFA